MTREALNGISGILVPNDNLTLGYGDNWKNTDNIYKALSEKGYTDREIEDNFVITGQDATIIGLKAFRHPSRS